MTQHNNAIQLVTREVVDKVLELLQDKVDRIILYGSYARGDFNSESDIDVLVLLNCSEHELREYRRAVSVIASRISLEREMEISLLLKDKATYEQWMDAVVFYQNVEREGVLLYENR